MRFRPKIIFFQTMLLLGVAFFWTSLAQAGSHHHHGKKHVISPFDEVNKGKPLHCILNMHDHFQNTPCPHLGRGGKSDFQEFRPDCGSHSGSPASSSPLVAKDLFKNATHEGFMLLQTSSKIEHSSDYKKQNHHRSIDHPPQFA